MTDDEKIKILQDRFSDLLNYESDDPTAQIDPLTYITPEGDACVHIAALRGDDIAIRYLIDLGANINQRGDMGNTPLHYARKHHNATSAALLVQLGASEKLRNEFGKQPGE